MLAPKLAAFAAAAAPRLLSTLLVGATPLLAQGGMEEFDETDPWTRGDPALFEALGYESVGSFLWCESERTEDVQATMGGLDALWVETEHFHIGSTLGTYRLVGDGEEKEKLATEFKELKTKLKKFKAPKKALDPWLRLHLWAQRAEGMYAEFLEDFNVPDGGIRPAGPYLGQKQKFMLLLCERKSELGRYLRAYETGFHDYAYRAGSPERGMFFGINAEAVRGQSSDSASQPIDSMLHNMVADNVAQNFVDGFDQNWFTAPIWLVRGVGTRYARKADPRWTQTGKARGSLDDEHWQWHDRVRDFVGNDFFTRFPELFAFPRDHEWKEREVMFAWSKTKFLLEEIDGDRMSLLSLGQSGFATDSTAPGGAAAAPGVEAGRAAADLAAAFDSDVDDLEEAWKKWAGKKLKKKKRKRRR